MNLQKIMNLTWKMLECHVEMKTKKVTEILQFIENSDTVELCNFATKLAKLSFVSKELLTHIYNYDRENDQKTQLLLITNFLAKLTIKELKEIFNLI